MNLKEFFKTYDKVALAFSGGVDSAYLLYEAVKNKVDVKAYYLKSEFQPDFELEDGKRLAEDLGVPLEVVRVSMLEDEIARNPKDRCYLCKIRLFDHLISHAHRDGYEIIIDGTNGSDRWEDRPGMKALEEMRVLSPLRICGITKEEIRKYSKEAGLFTWNKPAYACLATRIPIGEHIEKKSLEKVEASEKILFQLGFRDFRVRIFHGEALVQVKEEDLELLLEKREEVVERLQGYFHKVLLDLEVR